MNLNKWRKDVSTDTRAKLTFNNYPVTADEFEATLLRTAKPDDYVVVKLDIDTPSVEDQIIARVEKHAHLVDELFFEYHFWFDDMNFGWGKLEHLRPTVNVTTVVRRMQKLRRKGIRAHFWV